jgi:hypothetical protein
MSFTFDYNTLPANEKQAKAVKDCKNFLTRRQFKALRTVADDKTSTFMNFEMYCGIGGVQGYPVRALWVYFKRELPENETV